MSPVVWMVVGLAAIALTAIMVWSSARRSDAQLSAVRQEMQNSLSNQGQSVNAQINHLMQSVTTQLGQVRQELQSGVASSGKLASDAQIAMAQQLQSSSEAIRKISMQLAEVQLAGQEMSKSTQTLQNVLGGAKTRGILGEVVLERLLQDALPRSAYETQYRFDSTGAIRIFQAACMRKTCPRRHPCALPALPPECARAGATCGCVTVGRLSRSLFSACY